MSPKVLMSAEERLLHASFEHDRDYLDREIVGRSISEFKPADAQTVLGSWLRAMQVFDAENPKIEILLESACDLDP